MVGEIHGHTERSTAYGKLEPVKEGEVDKAKREAPVVLIVDDDADVLENAASWLRDEGFSVVTVPNGTAAIDRVITQPPAVVVLDLMMPGVTGWDVWDWLQQNSPNIPVVVWTATGLSTGALGSVPIISKNHPAALLSALQALV